MIKSGEGKPLPATGRGLSPGDFPIGSLQSRAMARALVESPGCICFPENEPPSVNFPIQLDIAERVKCPIHGARFKRPHYIYVPKWLRDKASANLTKLHSEQYQKAWHASFPAELWPAEEIKPADQRIFLRLKDGQQILAFVPTYVIKPRPCHSDQGDPKFPTKPLTELELGAYVIGNKYDEDATRAMIMSDGRTF